VRVEDASGEVIAAYRPAAEDVSDPLGSTETGTITFALPHDVLPPPTPGTRVTLLVGGQDDHGGAGIGDFRVVGAERTEWQGGGKTDPEAPNVYDILTTTVPESD
jgi:carbohydrate-binding DOMON domain-containing protein